MKEPQTHHVGDRILGHVYDEHETTVEGIIEDVEYDDGYLHKIRVLAHTGRPQDHTKHYDGYIHLWDFEIDETITNSRRHHFDV